MSELYNYTKTELRKELSYLRKQIREIETEFKRRDKKEPAFYKTILEFDDGTKKPVFTLVNMKSADYGKYYPAALTKKALIKTPEGPAFLGKFKRHESSEGGSDYDYGHTYHYTVDSFRFYWREQMLCAPLSKEKKKK